MTEIHCQDERRREAVRRAELNGLDYLEVSPDGLRLTVYFLGKAPERIERENVRITGGRRIRNIEVVRIDVRRQEDPERDDCMEVTVDRRGDFTTYRLCLVALAEKGKPTGDPLPGFDRRYACLDFSFMAGCPSDVDCKPQPACLPEERERPVITYLAKDYASFRQLILDRLSLVMPDWRDRHAPDLGITLVELLAYAGDHLSYYQDAVGTEAYIDTARERVSVRRHARLVDYLLHEGTNARAWLALEVAQEQLAIARDELFFTTVPDTAAGLMVREEELPPDPPFLVFEPVVEPRAPDLVLRAARNEICIHTWGDHDCCLPKGSVSATLRDRCGPPPDAPADGAAPTHTLGLQACDVLIFEEVKGPRTGNPADADPGHRHAVRLTRATPGVDELSGAPVWHVEWGVEDALPFPVCVSSTGPAPECFQFMDVSVVRGNVLLVDHGRCREDDLGQVPLVESGPACCDDCSLPEQLTVAGPYAPALPRPDVTFRQPAPACRVPSPCAGEHTSSAATLRRQDPRNASPEVVLYGIPAAPDGATAYEPSDLRDPYRVARALTADVVSPGAGWLRNQLSPDTLAALTAWRTDGAAQPLPPDLGGHLTQELRALQQTWLPRADLLGSGPDDQSFVLEMDDERRGRVRFGDGESGRRPEGGTWFRARYRVGNGREGNVGTEAIRRIVFRSNLPIGADIRARNPMPAVGGTAPESTRDAKLLAPDAFRRKLQRAVTPADYAAIVMRDFASRVQRASATMRWTGSGAEVMVAIDPFAVSAGDASLLCEVAERLERFRRIGHEIQVAWARAVALDVRLTVCVLPGHVQGHVRAALRDALGNRTLPNGGRGFFHPDKLTFGHSVHLSRLVAAAQAVPGVESVIVDRFQRLYEGPDDEIENGVLPLGPLEVARLDADPSFPEHGQLSLILGGGR